MARVQADNLPTEGAAPCTDVVSDAGVGFPPAPLNLTVDTQR